MIGFEEKDGVVGVRVPREMCEKERVWIWNRKVEEEEEEEMKVAICGAVAIVSA